jgi:glycolate oxidase
MDMISTLASVVGKEDVISDPVELIPYYRDHHRDLTSLSLGVKPACVVLPENTMEVRRIIEFAHTNKIPIVPRGGATNFVGGAIPCENCIVLDTAKMDKVLSINKDAMSVTVQAGILLSKLEKILEKDGFVLGHDPGSFVSATVGGSVSVDGSGIWRAIYGPMRDMVLGMKVVIPPGKIINIRGVQKSASGFNLKHLFIGSEGQLGIVTELTLLIKPLPKYKIFKIVGFRLFKDALEATKELHHRYLKPDLFLTLEYKRFEAFVKSFGLKKPGGVIILGFLGDDLDLINARIKAVLDTCFKHGGFLYPDEVADRWYEMRHSGYVIKENIEGMLATTEDVAVPLDRVEEMHKRFTRILNRYNLEKFGICVYNYPLSLSLGYMFKPDEEGIKNYLKAKESIVREALRLGGTTTASHGIGVRNKKFLLQEYGEAGWELMKKIKRAVDPNNIMNPGKWLDE